MLKLRTMVLGSDPVGVGTAVTRDDPRVTARRPRPAPHLARRDPQPRSTSCAARWRSSGRGRRSRPRSTTTPPASAAATRSAPGSPAGPRSRAGPGSPGRSGSSSTSGTSTTAAPRLDLAHPAQDRLAAGHRPRPRARLVAPPCANRLRARCRRSRSPTSAGPPRCSRSRGCACSPTRPSTRPGRKYNFGWGTSSRKLQDPALTPAELAPIDAVLLSHDHHDDNLDDAGREMLPSAGEGDHHPRRREAARRQRARPRALELDHPARPRRAPRCGSPRRPAATARR